MKIYSLITTVFVSFCLSATVLHAGQYVDSPAEAAQKSKSAKADLIVMAYGGEWDRIGKAYFNKCWKPAIKMIDPGTFVSTAEFPENPDKATKEKLEKEYKGLSMDFGSLPALFLFDGEGFCYASLWGQKLPKSPSSLAALIADLQAKKKKCNELVAQGRAAKGVEKAKLLGMAAEVQGINRNPQLVKDITAADPKDESGYVKKLTFSIWPLHECFDKPKEEALALLDKELASPHLSAEQKQTIYGVRGTVLRRNKATPQELKENYEKMYSLDPQSLLGKAAIKAMKAYAQ